MSGKSRAARMMGRAMRMPGALDRKGTRWLLQALTPTTVMVLVHRGRKSGRLYRTPVWTLVRLNGLEGDPEEAVLRALPMLGLRRVGS